MEQTLFKNWDLLTRAAPTKISVKKYFRFWPFHEMFMNHIKDMRWLTSIFFTEPGIDYNTANDFVQDKQETIDTEYQVLELAISLNDSIRKLKYSGLYTWIFISSDESAQDLLSKESDEHNQSGPLSWKLITTKILNGIK